MEVNLMIEGQEGVTWEDWLALARTCEQHGIPGLYRSDHYTSVMGAGARGSLDAWGTICGLAAVTATLRLGTLVSPASFRHPTILAKLAVTADHISGGRIDVGMGAGWHEPEHAEHGFPFHPLGVRMAVLTEQLELVTRQWKEGEAFDFEGEHYVARGMDAQPKPLARPRPRLLLGGSAGRRSAELAARFADEYNTVYATPDVARDRRAAVLAACERAGRDPATMGFSLMTGGVVGAGEAEVAERVRALAAWRGEDAADLDGYVAGLRESGWLIGTPDEVAAGLRALEEAGVERVMLQHNVHRDLESIALIGDAVAPAVA